MPNTRSAKKRQRQSVRANARNRASRSAIRTAIKKVRAAQTGKEAEAAYRSAEVLLDRAARTGLIHRNNVARHKSRLQKGLTKT